MLSREQADEIRELIDEGAAMPHGSRYPAMTYEDGLRIMLDFMECKVTREELMSDE